VSRQLLVRLRSRELKLGGRDANVLFIPTCEPEESSFESLGGFPVDVECSPPNRESRYNSSSSSFMVMISYGGLLCAREDERTGNGVRLIRLFQLIGAVADRSRRALY
jgi:hypothetical protein